MEKPVIPDLEPPVETPVVVPATAVPEQFVTLLRYLLVALGGLLAKKGLIDAETVDPLVGVLLPALLVAIPTLIGMLKDKRHNAVAQTLAEKLPDRVARVE